MNPLLERLRYHNARCILAGAEVLVNWEDGESESQYREKQAEAQIEAMKQAQETVRNWENRSRAL